MDILTTKELLEKKLKCLHIAHEQMLDILITPIELEDINEDKWKIVAEGKGKAQEISRKLIDEIKEINKELEEINNPNAKKEKKEATPDRNKHLQ